MQIRRMTHLEADTVSVLLGAVLDALPYYNARAKEEERAKYTDVELERLIEGDPDAVLVADRDGDIVGFCISRYDDGVLWLSWFGVRSDQRGKGVGRALLEAMESTCAARKCHKIWCDSRVPNQRSAGVLTAAGFEKVFTLVNHWYGQDFYIWEKSLAT